MAGRPDFPDGNVFCDGALIVVYQNQATVFFIKTAVGQIIVIAVNANDGACAQGGIFFPQADQILVEGDEFLIFLAPGIGAAAVGIRKAAKAGLVAVVNRRCAHPGHLHNDTLSEHRLVDALGCGVGAQGIGSAHLMIGAGQEAGVIVIGKLVHGHLPAWHGKTGGVMAHGAPKTVRVAQKVLPEVVAVLLHACQEPGHRLHEGIVVHDRIPFISLEPVPGGAVMLG